MKKIGKHYFAGVLLIPGILGAVAYGTTYATNDKKAGTNQTEVSNTSVVETPMITTSALKVDSPTNN
ncbi:hypothetical protein, partial [Lactococcus petauri]|uniref:hypothetical protein n=1 Tax=Lactococcus petauri TaxID=1940789 RepID=UPI0017837292